MQYYTSLGFQNSHWNLKQLKIEIFWKNYFIVHHNGQWLEFYHTGLFGANNIDNSIEFL